MGWLAALAYYIYEARLQLKPAMVDTLATDLLQPLSLHVADPLIAASLEKARYAGLSSAEGRILLASHLRLNSEHEIDQGRLQCVHLLRGFLVFTLANLASEGFYRWSDWPRPNVDYFYFIDLVLVVLLPTFYRSCRIPAWMREGCTWSQGGCDFIRQTLLSAAQGPAYSGHKARRAGHTSLELLAMTRQAEILRHRERGRWQLVIIEICVLPMVGILPFMEILLNSFG